MILPYKDVNPTNAFPYVTVAIIVLNVLLFAGQVFMDTTEGIGQSVYQFGFRPASLVYPGRETPGASPLLTLILSMFMHGGILHIVGNMLYLWIYGDNIEDVMGHGFYLMFYVTGGLLATLTHTLFHPDSSVPMIGASGAVAAVLGAYLVLYPHAKVKTFVWLFVIYMTTLYIPAWVLIGFFVATNLFMGVISMASPEPSGVAWFAHLGGLGFGLLLAIPFRSRLNHERRPRRQFDHWPREWRL